MIVYCKECGIPLTTNLKQLHDPSMLDDESGFPRIRWGWYYITPERYRTEVDEKGNESKTLCPLTLIVNIEDCINKEIDSTEIGCCGPDGADVFCSNQHLVGSEWADCWMPHYTQYELECIVMME
jgi:hypothetical protein